MVAGNNDLYDYGTQVIFRESYPHALCVGYDNGRTHSYYLPYDRTQVLTSKQEAITVDKAHCFYKPINMGVPSIETEPKPFNPLLKGMVLQVYVTKTSNNPLIYRIPSVFETYTERSITSHPASPHYEIEQISDGVVTAHKWSPHVLFDFNAYLFGIDTFINMADGIVNAGIDWQVWTYLYYYLLNSTRICQFMGLGSATGVYDRGVVYKHWDYTPEQLEKLLKTQETFMEQGVVV